METNEKQGQEGHFLSLPGAMWHNMIGLDG